MTVGLIRLGFSLTTPDLRISADSFNRPDSASVGTTEFGGFPWRPIGAGGSLAGWYISDGRLFKAAAHNPSGAPKLLAVNDGAAFNPAVARKYGMTLVSAGVAKGFGFREAADGSGGWLLSATAGGIWQLRTHTGTTYSSALWTSGTSLGTAGNDAVEVRDDGTNISVRLNGTEVYSAANSLYGTNPCRGPWVGGHDAASHNDYFHEYVSAP